MMRTRKSQLSIRSLSAVSPHLALGWAEVPSQSDFYYYSFSYEKSLCIQVSCSVIVVLDVVHVILEKPLCVLLLESWPFPLALDDGAQLLAVAND